MTIKNRQQREIKRFRRAFKTDPEILDQLSPIEKIRRRRTSIDGDYK